MKYLVTGATGHMGTHLVRQLVDEGHDVTALTRSRSKAGHLPEEITVAEGDVTDKESLRGPMIGVDGVFHCRPPPVGPWVLGGLSEESPDGVAVSRFAVLAADISLIATRRRVRPVVRIGLPVNIR